MNILALGTQNIVVYTNKIEMNPYKQTKWLFSRFQFRYNLCESQR